MRRQADFRYPDPQPMTLRCWFLVSVASGIAVLCLAFVLFVGLLIKPSWGHEAMSGWTYPWECCGGGDCAEISQDRVKFDHGGYVIDGEFHVLQSEVKHSPDGRYHACFPNPHELRCFFAPPQGS